DACAQQRSPPPEQAAPPGCDAPCAWSAGETAPSYSWPPFFDGRFFAPGTSGLALVWGWERLVLGLSYPAHNIAHLLGGHLLTQPERGTVTFAPLPLVDHFG